MGAVANVLATGSDTFSPGTTNINVNDTVIWTWTGSDHNVTSTNTPAAWVASPTENPPFSFTNTFTNAGTFGYECTIHVAEHMFGAIVVSAVATPPTLAITNPVSGAVFSAPANVKLLTSVTNGSSSVSSVQFYTNNVPLLTPISTAPFNLTASNLLAGSYALKAVATAGGIMGTSAVVNISVVVPVTVLLSNSTFSSPANFHFSYPANVGLSYVVQTSTNLALANWISLATNVAASNPVVFVDSNATNNAGYYRVGRLPNP